MNGKQHRIRVGRYTAALLVMVTGTLLIIDEVQGSEYMLLLLKWWPLIAIMWGVESILIYLLWRSDKGYGAKLRLDVKGLSLSILLTASVFIVTQQEHYLYLWNKVSLNLTASTVDYSEQDGAEFDKEDQVIPVALDSENIKINNINGDILLHREPIDDIQVSTNVWIDQITGPEREDVFEQSLVEVTEGKTINIMASGKAYGQSGKRQPRMNLDIAVPENRRFNIEVQTMNGDIKLVNVNAIENISLKSANGKLELYNVLGNVMGETSNGIVRTVNVEGNVDITSSQGNMEATDTFGTLKLSTQVGNISVIRAHNDVDIRTKNGDIYASQPETKLKVESLNGGITVYSRQIGGDWDIYSAVGVINLYLPLEANYKLLGSIAFGNVISSVPAFTIENKTIYGTVGEGEYDVRVEGNSDLNVNSF